MTDPAESADDVLGIRPLASSHGEEHQSGTDEPGEERFEFSLSAGEASTVMAALRRYLRYWEQHVAEDAGRAHSQEQLEAVLQDVGRLLYRLEGARTPAGARVEYSPEAALPNGATASEPVEEAPGAPEGADHGAIDWQGLDLDGAFAMTSMVSTLEPEDTEIGCA